jgi:hypothetical protein
LFDAIHEGELALVEICGSAEDVEEAIQQVVALRPDLVVVDIALKSSHGIELIPRIKQFDKLIRVLVWSMSRCRSSCQSPWGTPPKTKSGQVLDGRGEGEASRGLPPKMDNRSPDTGRSAEM